MSTKKNRSKKHTNLVNLTLMSVLFSNLSFANDYLDSAKLYLNKDEINAAVIELKNAIKHTPEDQEARFLLGRLFLEQGDFSSAEQQLSQALKYNYPQAAVTPLLARALINQNKLEDAFLFIKEHYPNEANTPADILAFAAIAEIKLSNLESAKNILSKITDKTLYVDYANALYLFATKQMTFAAEQIDKLVKTNEANSDFWLLKGHIETSLNNIDNAYQSYSNAYALAPKAGQYLFFIARSLVQLHRFEEANPLIDSLLATNGHNALINELKAISLFADKDYRQAKLHADKAINNNIDNFRLLAISGFSAFRLGQIEHSYKMFKRLSPKLPNNHPINRFYIMTQFKLGYIDDAIERIKVFPIETNEDSQFLSHVSVELTKIGRKELALALAKKASVKAQGRTQNLINFVKLANNDASSIENILNIIENNPSASSEGSKQGLANYYLMNGQTDEAESLANDWLDKDANDKVALSVLGLIHKKDGEYDNAKGYFEKVVTIEPNNLQAMIELAKIAVVQNDVKGAASLLLKAKKLSPSNHKVNKVFLQYHKQMGSLDTAISILDEQIKKAPHDTQLKIQKANALAINNKPKEAIFILESLTPKNKRVWRHLSQLYTKIGDKNNLEKSYQGWLKVDQFNSTPYLNYIAFLQQEDKLIEALRITNQAQKIFAKNSTFMMEKVQILLKQNNLSLANKEFERIEIPSKPSQKYQRIKVLLHIANKDYSPAINIYEDMFEIKPSSKLALELATLYLLNEQKSQAIDFLSPIVKKFQGSKHQDFVKIKLFLAELHLDDNPKESINLYNAIVTAVPDNIVALNNLSWLLFEQNELEKACSIAQKAHSLASTSANIADTYGYCLLKIGDTQKALGLLELAYQDKKEDPKIALHFAEALIEAQQVSKAAQVLANITTTTPELLETKNSLNKSILSLTQ